MSIDTPPYSIHYQIIPSHPKAHIFTVQVTVDDPAYQGQKFSLPAWIPGSYMIRDFAKNIIQIHAQSNGKDIAIKQLDKQTWLCEPCHHALTISYDVYAWDLSVRSAHLDTQHAFFNGSSVFLAVEGQTHKSCDVLILPPDSGGYDNWKVATTMPRMDCEQYEFGLYHCADYEELIDHPVEISDFMVLDFSVETIPHHIVFNGRLHPDTDFSRIKKDLQKICQQHISFFQYHIPFKEYLFIHLTVGEGYGGLEHRSSSALLSSRNDLPSRYQAKMTDAYQTFLGLCSHEYFHSWNVKRIKPTAFTPYHLEQENYTTLLWAFEGITSYYDDLALVRSGCINDEEYLSLFAKTITRVYRHNGRTKQTLQQSSFNAWTTFYQQNENAPNAIVSYYAKGALAAFALDMTIRNYSNHTRSLDDLMQILWQRYGEPGIGVMDSDIELIAEELANTSLHEFFNYILRSTQDIDLHQFFSQMGITQHFRPAINNQDRGGEQSLQKAAIQQLCVDWGMRVKNTQITHIFDYGSAQQAGLASGDEIIAINGLRADNNIDTLLSRYQPGDMLTLHIFRRDELLEKSLILQLPQENVCDLYLQENATTEQQQYRQHWLHPE